MEKRRSQTYRLSSLGQWMVDDYETNKEIGLHYQLHRGIGIHHTAYNASDEDFKVSIAIGGPPSHAFSAIMPMPEGISELTFAGMLGGRRYKYFFDKQGYPISADADFVITGTVVKNKKKPEGPFGDHLGYYSLEHDFPYMRVDNVYHRKDPLWHFTVVGRPPQEDSGFGYLIHKLVEELAGQEFPGLKESLAKFLFIAAGNDHPNLNTHDIAAFFNHLLERVDWKRDLHFQTKTTIDTLDYSGSGWNTGSKVIIACNGPQLRTLGTEVPTGLELPSWCSAVALAQKGILAISASKYTTHDNAKEEMEMLAAQLAKQDLESFPMIIVCDNAPA